MKTKIIEYIAGSAMLELCQAQSEAMDMRNKHQELQNTTDVGIGLDFAVLREHLEKVEKLISLLT